jgi:hypothetical protein
LSSICRMLAHLKWHLWRLIPAEFSLYQTDQRNAGYEFILFSARATDKLNIHGKGKRRKKTKLLNALTIPLNLLVSDISVSIIKRKNKKKFRLLDLNRWRYYYRLRLRWCIHESREKWLDGLQRHTQQLSRWLSLNFKSWHNTNRPI